MGLLETKDFGYRVWTWGLGVRSGLCVMRLLPSSSDRTGRVEWKYGEVRRLWSGPSNGAKGRGAFGMGCRLDVVGMEFARFPSRKECWFCIYLILPALGTQVRFELFSTLTNTKQEDQTAYTSSTHP